MGEDSALSLLQKEESGSAKSDVSKVLFPNIGKITNHWWWKTKDWSNKEIRKWISTLNNQFRRSSLPKERLQILYDSPSINLIYRIWYGNHPLTNLLCYGHCNDLNDTFTFVTVSMSYREEDVLLKLLNRSWK